MKFLFALMAFTVSMTCTAPEAQASAQVSAQASVQSSTAEAWLRGVIAESTLATSLIETMAVAQSFDNAPVACGYLNMKVLSLKDALNSTKFKVRIFCPVAAPASTYEKPVEMIFEGYVEDSMVFPIRIEVKN